MKIPPNTAVNIATFINKASQQPDTQKSDSSFSIGDSKNAQYVPVSSASSARAQAIISRREEFQKSHENSCRALLECEQNSQKFNMARKLKSLQAEISLQAAKELNLPSEPPFWLMDSNWDSYINGGPMMLAKDAMVAGNRPHPQSDQIRRFLDSRPEQVAEIKRLADQLQNFPNFEQWLKNNDFSYQGGDAQASLESAQRKTEFMQAEAEIASRRASIARKELGRSYGGA